MCKKLFFSAGLMLLACCALLAQDNPGNDTTAVNALIAQSKGLIDTDSAKAHDLALEAKGLAGRIRYPKGEAYALKNIGMLYYQKGRYVETLDYWSQSLQKFEELKDDIGIANMLNNIGAIYFNQGADAKALEYTLKSLQVAERIGDTLRIVSALINVGNTYYNKKDPVALGYLLRVIPLVEKGQNMEEYVVVTGNIGEIYFDKGDYAKAAAYFNKSIKAADTTTSSAFSYSGIGKIKLKEGKFSEALYYHNQALGLAKKFEDKLQEVRGLRGIADVYFKMKNEPLAFQYYNRARVVAEGMDDLQVELRDLYGEMAKAYSKGGNYSEAFAYQSLYSDLNDTLYNIESKKKLNQLQFDFELSKKEVEINLKEARIRSERQVRLGLIVGLVLILMIAFIIYRNSLQKTRINKILDKQKDQIEHLLLNILPKEVAYELQTSGISKPRQYNEVSILFTDFKGFTSIADKLSPTELVEDLNECFIEFDAIMEKFNLEKIKTIGDSYMCAGNLPSPDPDHVYKIVKAALAIQGFMEKHNLRRIDKGLQPWEIRIGLHVGPVVAGVVGKKKYAYDIWGSAVNIASRMESNGTPGKVNVSADTYELIKHRFDCTHRGKLTAKNLGDLDMYYVDKEKAPNELPEFAGLSKEELPLLQ
ncbi:MAG TPA: adenylate/guanylate cyclase domain-containing protein [Flavisolibacter sp.]|jgi:class 3 adenylate cyclase